MRNRLLLLAGAFLLAGSTAPVAWSVISPPESLPAYGSHLTFELGTGERDVRFEGTVGGSAIAPAKLTSSQNNYDLRFTYGIADRFSAYALLGIGSMNVGNLGFAAGGIPLGVLGMKGDPGLLWGVGANYGVEGLAFAPDMRIGASAEYRHTLSRILNGDIQLNEFRFALKASRTFDKLTPYGGIVYSALSGNYKGATSSGFTATGSIESDDDIGLVAGAEYAFSEKLTGRLEAEFISSTAISLGIIYNLGGPWLNRSPSPVAPPPVAADESERRTSVVERPWRAEESPPPMPERRAASRTLEERDRRVKPPTRPEAATAANPDLAPPATSTTPPRDPRTIEEWVRIGNELTAQGRYDEATVNYRRAVAADPGDQRAVYNMATAQYLNRDYAGAMESYESTIRLNPRDPEAHLFLGFCHYRMGQIEGAVRAWQRVLELDPENAVALNNLQALGR